MNDGEGWEATVADYAQLQGWKVGHFRKARTKKGWRTPVGRDGKGFFDFVMVRERVIFVECKSGSGKRTPEQKLWAAAVVAAGEEYYLWRPEDWDEVARVLSRPVEPTKITVTVTCEACGGSGVVPGERLGVASEYMRCPYCRAS